MTARPVDRRLEPRPGDWRFRCPRGSSAPQCAPPKQKCVKNTRNSAALAAYEKYELDVSQSLAEDSLVIHIETLSLIEDADFAEEASNLATSQILAEGALAAISVSNRLEADHIEAQLEGIDIVSE